MYRRDDDGRYHVGQYHLGDFLLNGGKLVPPRSTETEDYMALM